MRRILPALIAAVALGLSACGGGNDYPKEVEDNFLSSCKSGGGSEKQCECALDKIQDEFTYEEFKQEEKDITSGKEPSKKLTDATKECAG
jgi:hypothetical protein